MLARENGVRTDKRLLQDWKMEGDIFPQNFAICLKSGIMIN